MVDHKGEEITQIVINALRETKQRGILLGGWNRLGSGDLLDLFCKMMRFLMTGFFRKWQLLSITGGLALLLLDYEQAYQV